MRLESDEVALDPNRTCYNKFKFSSKEKAEEVARKLSKRNKKHEPKEIRRPVKPYKCTFCGKWHVGHCINNKYQQRKVAEPG